VEAAGAAGRPVAAHAHAREGIRHAVEAGVASVEHGTFADRAVLRAMAASGTFLVPTLEAAEALLRHPEVLSALPPHLRARLTETREVHLEAVRTAHRLGVPIAMGTDAGTPGNHHGENAHECVDLVERVGMTPAESLAAATVGAARLLGQQGRLGTLDPGARADVVGLREDPLSDIRALTRVALVVKAGVPVSPTG
jgi:imidazolonepropionase-like amidohydrolase